MSRKDHCKIPKSLHSPEGTKAPMAGVIPSEQARPEFKTGQMDAKGPWGWDYFNPIEMRELLQKIFDSQKLSWQDLRNQGSHLIDRKDLCSEAQKRLIQLQKDDLDQLFSLRLTGKKRIWGIKEGNILWMLWWDPNHEVCPSIKKHT